MCSSLTRLGNFPAADALLPRPSVIGDGVTAAADPEVVVASSPVASRSVRNVELIKSLQE